MVVNFGVFGSVSAVSPPTPTVHLHSDCLCQHTLSRQITISPHWCVAHALRILMFFFFAPLQWNTSLFSSILLLVYGFWVVAAYYLCVLCSALLLLQSYCTGLQDHVHRIKQKNWRSIWATINIFDHLWNFFEEEVLANTVDSWGSECE